MPKNSVKSGVGEPRNQTFYLLFLVRFTNLSLLFDIKKAMDEEVKMKRNDTPFIAFAI